MLIMYNMVLISVPNNCDTIKVNNPELFKAKARLSTIKDNCKLILGTRQLANLLKDINKNVGKFTKTKQMVFTGKTAWVPFQKEMEWCPRKKIESQFTIYRRFSIRSCGNLSLVIPNHKRLEH